ncbi:MAG: ABC transporter ATP-binding protein [Deltaproteobacteria bacterium]|jgi:iron complex transport system ATP-binding protein|nr:ABC transporter ATP-binding protein [Deltaproteobacteria bacterium]
MIQVSNLGFAFAEHTIFEQLNFNVNKGEILSIIGPNGCGKSTLLRLLRGNLRASSGNITWDAVPVRDIPTKTLARKVAIVPQSTHIDFPYKVHEVVAMGRYPHRKSLLSFADKIDRQSIRHALAICDILNLAERPVTELSGGELQRVLVARALAQSTEVLFLDEATSHLDIDHRLELCELLIRLNREQGTTVVQISHDLDLAAAVSQRILLLTEHGKIAGIGTPVEVMTATNLHRVFRVDVKVEKNPFTGAPQILPMVNASIHQLAKLKIHLICGGGSGKSLLRRLHLAKAQITVGPLNRGDSDEALATALSIETVREQPYSPYSKESLKSAGCLIDRAEILIVTTLWWGTGNLACLQLAHKALDQQKTVYLVGSQQEHDYTGGKAWDWICRLKQQGARIVDNEELLLEELSNRRI